MIMICELTWPTSAGLFLLAAPPPLLLLLCDHRNHRPMHLPDQSGLAHERRPSLHFRRRSSSAQQNSAPPTRPNKLGCVRAEPSRAKESPVQPIGVRSSLLEELSLAGRVRLPLGLARRASAYRTTGASGSGSSLSLARSLGRPAGRLAADGPIGQPDRRITSGRPSCATCARWIERVPSPRSSLARSPAGRPALS